MSPAQRRQAALEWIISLVRDARRAIARDDLLGMVIRQWGVSHDTAWHYLDDLLGERPPRIAVRYGWFVPIEKVRDPEHFATLRGRLP